MSPDPVADRIRKVLRTIAPEADLDALAPRAELRDALDIDSMDFLRFVVGLHNEFSVEIPESDYPRLATLEGCVAYVTTAGRG